MDLSFIQDIVDAIADFITTSFGDKLPAGIADALDTIVAFVKNILATEAK
ncbi:MAG: hypothetical protein LBT21_00300 [Oscillospiraceae bacterium]|jgi:hypothetical protein|nr:hypothetical protein [Oscillospiraceae bacterium]